MAKISKEHITQFFENQFNYETRTLYIGAPTHSSEDDLVASINAQVAADVIKGLHILETVNHDPIKIYLNSTGGDIYHGLAIHDAIRACVSPVTIKGTGHIMSAASVIMQAAEDRFLTPNTIFMLHDGEDGYVGHPRDFERWADWSKTIRTKIYGIYSERSGKDVAYWRRKMDHDYILTAEQAIAEGLADKIIPHVKIFDK